MAEVLGIVASGMSIVSLGIQVAESINKLRAFYSLIKSAPTDLHLLLDELETLSLILEDIDCSFQNELFLNPAVKAVVMRSYRLCRSSGEALAGLARELEEGLNTGKKKGNLKIAMSKDKIADFRKRLESAKATMLLANQCYNQAVQQQNWQSYERDRFQMMATMSNMSQVLEKVSKSERQEEVGDESDIDATDIHPSTNITRPVRRLKWPVVSRTATKSLFGQLDVVRISHNNNTASTEISLAFPSWIHSRRYQFCLSKSYQGWQQTLRSYRVTSYDDLVFQYSMEGDVLGLQGLFETGIASPFVVDPDGRTPLHYAAIYARPEACLFLLQNGSDANIRTSWQGDFGFDLWAGGSREPWPGLRQKEATFRGLPAYSTPLHMLAYISGELIHGGRKSLSELHSSSTHPIENDVFNTIRILVENGETDVLYEDQFGLAPLHSYSGPYSNVEWMKKQCREEIANLKTEDLYEFILSQAFSTLAYNDVDGFRKLLPGGQITREVAQMKSSHDSRLEPGSNLLVLIVLLSTLGPYLQENLAYDPDWDSIIVELVAAGSDVHVFRGVTGETLLYNLIHLYVSLYASRWGKITDGTKWFLRLLAEGGVDLEEFGQKENAIHNEEKTSWVFSANMSTTPGVKDYCIVEMLELQIEKAPDNLRLVFEDLYVSAGLAADFWLWVEDDFEMAIPGAWCDD